MPDTTNNPKKSNKQPNKKALEKVEKVIINHCLAEFYFLYLVMNIVVLIFIVYNINLYGAGNNLLQKITNSFEIITSYCVVDVIVFKVGTYLIKNKIFNKSNIQQS